MSTSSTASANMQHQPVDNIYSTHSFGGDALKSRGSGILSTDDAIIRYATALARDVSKQVGIAEAAAYSCVGLLIVVGYHMASDGVFSSIVTLASVIQFLGLILSLLKVQQRGAFGIMSIKSLQLLAVVYVLRLICTLFNEGYLPIDQSGDWAYQTSDAMSFGVIMVLLAKSYQNPTVRPEKDFPMFIIIAACIALATFIHPCHNLGTWSDTAWTASVYLETFVMIPQLRLIAAENSVESLTSHSIACTFLYRAMNFYFWFVCRRELVRTRCPTQMPSYFVVGALGLQTVLLLDFMFYYVRAVVNQGSMCLPTFEI